MANSDKNILITPSVGLSTNPTIKFNGANNTPTTLRVLDDGTVSFEGTAGQLFSISDGLTGSIFSVNDISGIPSIEVLDTGLVKLNQYGGSTVFGSSAAIQNASSVNAKVSISTTSATTPGLIIKGVSSQSANLQEWQNSSASILAQVDAYGSASFGGNNTYGSSLGVGVGGNASQKGITVRGTASQTANLQEWQNSSGTVLANINSAGGIKTNAVYTDQFYNGNDTGPYLYSLSSGWTITNRTTVSNIIFTIKGMASQTGDLQQWQNSSGSILAKIDVSGDLTLRNLISSSVVQTPYLTTQYTATIGGYAPATNVPLTVKGATSQTANLQEWQNSSGTVLASVTQDGDAKFRLAYVGTTTNYGAMFNVNTFSAGNIGILIQGVSSQTGDLQQWRNNIGTVLAKVDASGNFTATSKSFDIEHPTKENMRLRYGSLEGPENGVYVRGTTTEKIIELPDYWVGLVDEKTITVNLTAVGISQNIHVSKIENNKVYIGGDLEKAFFTVYGERKDIDKLTVEY